jgi:hypothetical protein
VARHKAEGLIGKIHRSSFAKAASKCLDFEQKSGLRRFAGFIRPSLSFDNIFPA